MISTIQISTSQLALYGLTAIVATAIAFLGWVYVHLRGESRRMSGRAARPLEKSWPRPQSAFRDCRVLPARVRSPRRAP
jgi:hypothetical protein